MSVTQTIITKDQKIAVLLGAEGYVGFHLLKRLVENHAYKQINIYTEQPLKHESEKVVIKTMAYAKMVDQELKGNDLYICYDASFFNMGGKYAIPKSSYKYIPKIAMQAHESGMDQLMLLSSKRANKNALLFSHRIRGLIEESIKNIRFWSIHIFRPSLIIGESTDTEWGKSIANEIGARVNKLTDGWLKRNQPIEAEQIARAMSEVAQQLYGGTHFYPSDWLQDFAAVKDKEKYLKKKNEK